MGAKIKNKWRNIIVLLMLVFGFYINAKGETNNNYLEIEDIEATKGMTIEVPVIMHNIDDITAFQCKLKLSEGLSVNETYDVYDITLTDRKGIDHQLTAIKQQDGSINLLCYSMQTLKFLGNEGALFNINVNVAEDAIGEQMININNIILTSKSIKYTPADVSATISIMEDIEKFVIGDANGDGVVNVTDVVAITNYILGLPSVNFQFEVSDANRDGEVNVTDVVAVTNIILGISSN